MAKKPSGRLELTWANKDKSLLSHDDGSYEWVGKRDRRVAEVRLLRDAGTVGEVHDQAERAKDNLLIRGDALHALTALTKLPEFADEYVGKVKLVYIDPPFNTGQAFEHYDDGLEHSVWLTMMRDRLVQIKKLLAPDGSVWVHLDDAEGAYCKVLLDEIFGRENFVATVVWERRYSQSNMAVFSPSHDFIHVYAADREQFAETRNKLPRGAEQDARYSNPDNDPKGPWKPKSLQARNSYSLGTYPIETPSGRTIEGPPSGTYWRVSKVNLERLDAEGGVYWGKKGDGVPVLKTYLSEVGGLVPKTWWSHAEAGHNDLAKAESKKLFPGSEPFDTPKPEKLMERIVQISTNPGDVVLDCFAGSATTAAVAHKLGRRWITSEVEGATIDKFSAPRLKKVVTGADLGGISGSVEWNGGGGFRTLDVAPSLYQEDHGLVFLADWAIASDLSEAVAAQLGFDYEPDAPFCGRRGRVRLAVIDGHVTRDVAKTLVDSLEKGESLSLVATSVDPELDSALGKMRRGSRARVAPEDLLIQYAKPSSWQVSVAKASQPKADEAIEVEAVATETESVA